MQQPITRRQFTVATGGTIALTVLGCGKEETPSAGGSGSSDRPKKKPSVPASAFSVGSVDQYKAAGMHDNHHFEQRVWLYSSGSKLIALLDVCTHSSCALEWDAENNQLNCPCHLSKFDTDGRPVAGSKATEPLERLTISVKDGQIEIDPTKKFYDQSEWESPQASLTL